VSLATRRYTNRGTRAFTLLEMVVASAIIMIITIAITNAFVPMNKAAATTGVGLDMDRTARRVLTEIRRDLRGSGYKPDGTRMAPTPEPGQTLGLTEAGGLLEGATDVLIYQVRTGPDDDADWSTTVTLSLVADGQFTQGVPAPVDKYRLVRTQDGISVELARDVSEFTVERPLDSSGESGTAIITLELLHPDPTWTVRQNQAPIRRRYTDTIELLNPVP
jgi:type II secretory pathway pseudopilin PulG